MNSVTTGMIRCSLVLMGFFDLVILFLALITNLMYVFQAFEVRFSRLVGHQITGMGAETSRPGCSHCGKFHTFEFFLIHKYICLY